jgi:adenylosuccinate lyase
VDAILLLYINIAGGLAVYPEIAAKHLREELPFMATEDLLMHCVKKGGDRQALHERIRLHAAETSQQIKQHGGENDLIARILADPAFGVTGAELDGLLCAEQFTGRAKEQTGEFLAEARTIIEAHRELLGVDARIAV